MSDSPHSVVVLQHESGAPAAILGDSLREAGFRLDVRRLCSGDEVPGSLAGHDALIVLGGEMNVGEEADYPFLAAEQELLGEAVRSGLPTLGICLGAQQLAASCCAPRQMPSVGTPLRTAAPSRSRSARRKG